MQHLPPAGAQGETPSGRCSEISIQVVPLVECKFVPEAAVEFEQERLVDVLDVALHSPRPSVLLCLSPALGQPVSAFDVPKVAAFECRHGS